MIQEMNVPAEVLQRIDALAVKVGVTAEHLWPELVRYEYWSAVYQFFAPALLLVMAASALIAFRRYFSKDVAEFNRKEKCRSFDSDVWSVLSVICLAAFMILSIGFLVSTSTAATSCAAIFSPEAAALRSLLGK